MPHRFSALIALLKRHPDAVVIALIAGAIFYGGVRWERSRTEPLIRRTARETSVRTIEYMYSEGLAPKPERQPETFVPWHEKRLSPFLSAAYGSDDIFSGDIGLRFHVQKWLELEAVAPFELEANEWRSRGVRAQIRLLF